MMHLQYTTDNELSVFVTAQLMEHKVLYVSVWVTAVYPTRLWCFSLSGDRNRRPYRHDTASSTDSGLTHGARELAHVGTSRWRCLPPPHSACQLSTTNEALPLCSCRNRRAGGERSGDAAEFRWWSQVLTGLQSYILLISLLSACLPVITCRSVNYAICW